ncbi:WYL domain-containing protein [Phyllobacterium sophorae]|uniref:WYL domain-containing protein n=1 Tax=Phyllobacterium sophorae TaxID=1520277 RepID=A0A2P7B6X4_9HYPH|nr:WYL domain-containing protein [Phyllobacterium sophorae]PSH62224.1 WYL domain-containing protein [Phyllobacterium sophorae]
MTGTVDHNLKWGVAKRLEFIDFRLFWDGFFNRKDIVDFFGISEQQASSDISAYQLRAQRNLRYDPSKKSFVRTADYKPEFIGPFSDRFLLQLMAVNRGLMSEEDTWFSQMPPIEVVGQLRRRPTNPTYLLRILDAIKQRGELELGYESLTGSPGGIRVVAPHSFLYSADRWYVRAWSEQHNDFRDYNLNRITSAGLPRECDIDPSMDLEWHHTIELALIPNPRLDKAKQVAVAAEYDMTDDELRLPCRLSAAFYLINEHNLDLAGDKIKPEKQQLVLRNLDEVIQAREVVRKLSVEALRNKKSR